jgi:hypothetical protein
VNFRLFAIQLYSPIHGPTNSFGVLLDARHPSHPADITPQAPIGSGFGKTSTTEQVIAD